MIPSIIYPRFFIHHGIHQDMTNWKEYHPPKSTPPAAVSLQGVSVRQDTIAIAYIHMKHFETWVSVFIDEETGKVGLKPTQKGAKLVKKRGEASASASVFSCKPFITEYQIVKKKYPAEWSEEDGMLIFTPESRITQAIPEEPESTPQQPKPLKPQPLEPTGDVCPICKKGKLEKGECSECGWDEAEGIACSSGLLRPDEDPTECEKCKLLVDGNCTYDWSP